MVLVTRKNEFRPASYEPPTGDYGQRESDARQNRAIILVDGVNGEVLVPDHQQRANRDRTPPTVSDWKPRPDPSSSRATAGTGMRGSTSVPLGSVFADGRTP